MTVVLPKDVVIDALAAEYQALDHLLAELGDDEWARLTPCPGWDVHANVAHMIGTEASQAGLPAPERDAEAADPAHVRNPIGAFNEAWVEALAPLGPDEMRQRLHDITQRRLGLLRDMDEATWNAEGFTPAGQDTYGRFMRIRVFDCWMHEQDIRDAVGRPGHEEGPEVDLALDEMVGALGYIVGKKAGAPSGTTVTLALTGGAAREVHVAVNERATLVDSLSGPPTVTLRMPVGVFTRLGGGRVDPAAVADRIDVEGDVDLGQRIVANLAYTI